MKVFSVNGHWVENTPDDIISGLLVCEYDEQLPEGYNDQDIFFYGVNEQDLIDGIKNNECCIDEFVVTSYEIAFETDKLEPLIFD